MGSVFCIEDYLHKKNIIDVRTLLIINICISIIMLKASSFTVMISAFIISMLIMFMFKMFKTAFKYAIAFLVCCFLSIIPQTFTIHNAFFTALISFLGFIGFMNIKLLSCIMIAHVIIKKVHSAELIAALQKMKLHKGFILSLTIALRFLPTAKKEFKIIKECMAMRGIETSFKNFFRHPLIVIEYSLVPLLFRSVKISDEMTAAALVKGVEHTGAKTSLVEVGFGKADFFIIIFSALLITYASLYENLLPLVLRWYYD